MKELYSQFKTNEKLSNLKILDKVMKKIVHFNEEQILFVYKITKFVSISMDSKNSTLNSDTKIDYSKVKNFKDENIDFLKGKFDKDEEIQIENLNDYSGSKSKKGYGHKKGKGNLFSDIDQDKPFSEDLSDGNINEEFLKLKDSDSFNKEKTKGLKGK